MAVAAPTVAPLRIKLEARRLHIVPIDCPEATSRPCARARAAREHQQHHGHRSCFLSRALEPLEPPQNGPRTRYGSNIDTIGA